MSDVRSDSVALELIKRTASKYVLPDVLITSSTRFETWWQEKQKNVPLRLSTSPAGERELL